MLFFIAKLKPQYTFTAMSNVRESAERAVDKPNA